MFLASANAPEPSSTSQVQISASSLSPTNLSPLAPFHPSSSLKSMYFPPLYPASLTQSSSPSSPISSSPPPSTSSATSSAAQTFVCVKQLHSAPFHRTQVGLNLFTQIQPIVIKLDQRATMLKNWYHKSPPSIFLIQPTSYHAALYS